MVFSVLNNFNRVINNPYEYIVDRVEVFVKVLFWYRRKTLTPNKDFSIDNSNIVIKEKYKNNSIYIYYEKLPNGVL